MSWIFYVIIGVIIGLLFFVYSDEIIRPFKNHFRQKEAAVRNSIYTERMAKLRLLSTNIKEIESFVEKNVSVLEEKTMDELLARIQTLRDDQVIMNDDRFRFEKFEPVPEVQEEPEPRKSRSSRKK